MKREIIYSVGLHLIVIALAFASAPFTLGSDPFDYGEVIKITAVDIPEFSEPEPIPFAPVDVPKALPEEVAEDIPISDPTSIDKPVPVEKPVEKPKDKPKPKKPKTQNKKPADKPKDDGQTAGSPAGDKEIKTTATGAGSPFAGATIDNASFDYPYWFTQAFNKIAGNFRRTVSLDGNVVCVIYFQVIKSGRVIDIQIKQSSGIDPVDRDCLSAIERSAPFPPLPKEFRDEIIGITIPIKY